MKTTYKFAISLLAMAILPFTEAAPTKRWDHPELCEIAGAAYGANKSFIGSLASRLLYRDGITAADPKCGPIWREAYQVGLKASQGTISSQSEMDLIQRLQKFEEKVLDSILRNIETN
jgi:hypothetical protein